MQHFETATRRLAYVTHGTLNPAADNCVILPTYYTGTHNSYTNIIGPTHALNPTKYFIVIPNMLGNGLSSSPSNTSNFTNATIAENVHLQHALIKSLGVKSIAAVYGWSMGATQSYAWAALYPHMVRAILAVCGAAKCWPLNQVFLEGIESALNNAKSEESGKRAFGRIYAGWAYSAAFYRDALYQHMGFPTLEDFLKFWEEDHVSWPAADLLAMLWTWKNASTDLTKIRARTIIMPSTTDAYFTQDEAALEAAQIPGAELRPIHSPYGHCAGAPGRFTTESAEIEKATLEILYQPS